MAVWLCSQHAPPSQGCPARARPLRDPPAAHCDLSGRSAQIIIAELLKVNETVKRLDLARNNIGDIGVCAIAQMLRSNSSIEYLNLESNEFGERGEPMHFTRQQPVLAFSRKNRGAVGRGGGESTWQRRPREAPPRPTAQACTRRARQPARALARRDNRGARGADLYVCTCARVWAR